jgi:hypothetical protein
MSISNSISISNKKKHRLFLFMLVLLFSTLNSGCASNIHDSFAGYNGYVITLPDAPSSSDVKWGTYLFNHLRKRSMKSAKIVYLASDDKELYQLQVHINQALDKDYKIECSKAKVVLLAKNESVLLWLIYQLYESIGKEDERINVSDLPPASLTIKDTEANVSFEYREVYFPENKDPDISAIYGMNNVNLDWGLWGHHLSLAIGKFPDSSVYATVNGRKYEGQYCFSSEETYHLIESYIMNNYGDGRKKSYRFSIFPNDDDCVCTCAKCRSLGNNATNATPAVTYLAIRLARRFPEHQFFTSCYLTTAKPATEIFPSNLGVIISSIDLPLKPGKSYQRSGFTDLVERWQKVTSRVYVWDYVNNFDDYLSPFPLLKIEQERLQYFYGLGIKGVFFNGSGDSYSSFSDLHYYVLSLLLIDPYRSVDEAIHSFYHYYYPVSADMLQKYYVGMSNYAFSTGHSMNLYGGIQEEMNSYLQPTLFLSFYRELNDYIEKTKGDERQRLCKLVTALSFTRLELARRFASKDNGCLSVNSAGVVVKPEILTYLKRLSNYYLFHDMAKYSESGGEIGAYISDWSKYIISVSHNNLLRGKKLKALTTLDESYEDLSVLTDGLYGLPSNYHSGWLISSVGASLDLSLPILEVKNAHSISISFLHSPKFHLFVPQCIEILKNGKLYKIIRPLLEDTNATFETVNVRQNIDISDAFTLTVRIIRPGGKHKNIACDEIQLNP